MGAVRDFALKDKIFPGIPGDSLLFDGTELTRLQQKNYSILMHLPLISHTGHSSNLASGGASSNSTFKSDAEAQGQGVMPLVTPPTTPQLQGWQEVTPAPLSQGESYPQEER